MRLASDHSLYVAGGLRLDDEVQGALAQNMVLRCCGYLPNNSQWNFLRVFSPFWRLYYNFSAGHHIMHNGRRFPLTPDRFLLVPEETLFHCASPGGNCDHLYVHFSLPPGHRSLLHTPMLIEVDAAAILIAKKLASAIGSASIRQVTQLSAALLYWVLAKLPEEAELFRQPSASLQKAVRYIQEHVGERLSNPILARAAGVSVRALVRLFEKEIHLSPQAHIRAMRLREAARRLANRSDSIDRIAEELGFPNRYYFTRRFTKQFGCPPGAFRKRVDAAKQGSQTNR